MKLNKIFAFTLTALALTACSDDDSFNSASDVTVSMGEATIDALEDYIGTESFCYVPIKLSGKANGPVKVTVAVEEDFNNGAIETAHYYITSKTVVIPKGVTEVNVEFYPTGDEEINEDRKFTMFIDKVEGATVEGLDHTEITLLDDDKYLLEVYPQIQGDYTFTATGSARQTWSITGVQENEEGYPRLLYISGLQGYPWCEFPCKLTYNPIKSQAQIIVTYGTTFAKELDFSLGALQDVALGAIKDGSLVRTGNVVLTASRKYTGISFPNETQWCGYLINSETGLWEGYTWFRWSDMKLKRK